MERNDLRAARARSDPQREVDAGLGRGAHLQHDRHPARLVHLAPARLGRADHRVLLRRAAASRSPTARFSTASWSCSPSTRADIWYERTAAELLPAGHDVRQVRRRRVHQGKRHSRRLVRFRLEPPGRAQRPRTTCPGRPTCISKAAISIAAGSTARCWSASALKGGAPYRELRHQRLDARWRRPRDVTSRSATPSSPRRSSSSTAPRCCGCGRRRSNSTRTSGSRTPSSRGSPKPTASCATRSATRSATCRDFDPATDAVPPTELLEIDQWILLARRRPGRALPRLVRRVRVPQGLSRGLRFRDRGSERHLFRRAEGPALHVGARSRRRAAARRRRSIALLDALVRLLAPLLSFTAEEVWTHMRPAGQRPHWRCSPSRRS